MFGRFAAGLASLAAMAVALGGCTAARMRVPGELAGERAALLVKRDTGLFGKGALQFGEHRVSGFRRGWGGEESFGIGNVSYHRLDRAYEFKVRPAGRSARAVRCATTESFIEVSHETTLFGRPATSSLEIPHEARRFACEIGGGAGRIWIAQAELPTLSNPTGRLAGTFSLGAVTVEIRSIERLDDGRPVAFAGFELSQGQRVVAAVETINAGRVWLAHGASPEVEEAAVIASAALLLNDEWNTSVF